MPRAGRLDLLDLEGLDGERRMIRDANRAVGLRDDIDDQEQSPEEDSYSFSEETETSQGLGTGTLISAINKLPDQTSKNIFDTIIVNVSTIVRNNTVKDRPLKEIHDKTEADVHDLIRCIGNYHEVMSGLVRDPKLLLYLPDYSWLPPIHARPNTGNRAIISQVTDMFIKEDNLVARKRIRSNVKATTLLLSFAGGRVSLPYKRLMGEIRELYSLGRVDPNSMLTNYLLISHAPLDYHFMLHYPRTMLLESFTGKFLPPKVLGHKVFGTNFIPFNSVTHLLFGDSVHVRPMAQRKNRALLTELAKNQRWFVRTPMEIAKFVGVSGQVGDARLLTMVKL